MSKPKTIRLSAELAARVEELADEERRSLPNMVAVLLERALSGNNKPIISTSGSGGAVDVHFKPDPK